ncbi:MAG: DUF2007 domain-containing protein [Phycisphaerae bacterium]|nr:DUF2007 domain-containing protein [Phycisphaerae bacterium]
MMHRSAYAAVLRLEANRENTGVTMKKVYTAGDPVDANHFRLLLEAEGIAAEIMGESLWAARGAVPMDAGTCPSLWVADEDYEQARRFVLQHDGPPNPSHCAECGYDLTGLPEPRCPECGRPFFRPKELEPWVCPQCGETIDGQFTECWKCAGDVESSGAE